MKLVIILLGAFSFQAAAKGYSQVISLFERDAPIEKVFSSIRKQTGYSFIYQEGLLRDSKTVTVNVKNVTLKVALDLVFKDQPLTYEIFENSIIAVKRKIALNIDLYEPNPIDVKGKVTDEKGEPVEGVTVTIKGTKTMAITNENGEFSLNSVDKAAILVFTSVNMEAFELKVNGRAELIVTLKTKISALGNVIVTVNTGYQEISKERATGSYSRIDKETLNQQVGVNVLNRLDGVTSGVYFNIGKKNLNPQNNTNISIRGLSTINGPLDPLIVLDNFVYEGDISNINPNDIESITVLKDAAATSIYGARGGNGVIVISTKKGKFNQPLKIELATSFIVASKPDLFYLPQMKSGDYINVEETLFNQGYFDNDATSSEYPALTPATEIFLKRRNGILSAADSAAQINALKMIDSREQYKKYFYHKATTQTYAINLSGGGGNYSWLVSGAYDRSISDLNSKFDKLNLRVDNSYKPIKNLLLNFGVYYTNSKSVSGNRGVNTITVNGRTPTYLQFADDFGNPLSIASSIRAGYTDTAGAGKLLNWKYYPLEEYKHAKTATNTEEIVANIGLNYHITSGLNFDIRYQYERQNAKIDGLADLESFAARNYINLFTQLDQSSGALKYIVPKGGILTLANSYLISQNLRGQFNFNKEWKQHDISGIVGAETREIVDNSNSATYYGYNSDPLIYSPVDPINSYPTYITGNSSVPGSSPQTSKIVTRFVSVYANAAYTFEKKYTLTLSARRDGSNIFGVKTNDKWKPLWSAGLGWEISKENFYKIEWLPYLRAKATYGYSGNVDLSRSALAIASYFSNSPLTSFPFVRINTINNPQLRWEQVNQVNFGIEFHSKNHIISGSIEYYLKKGTDLYAQTPYDFTTWGGASTVIKNVAGMKGKGLDIVLKSKNLDRRLKWATTLLLNYNTNKTTAYFTETSLTGSDLVGSGGIFITPVVGKPLYAIAAYKWGGLDSKGDPQGYVNGQLSTDYNSIINEVAVKGVQSENIIYKGSATPTYFGSIINEFSYKRFSIAANISFRLGYWFKKSTLSYSSLINSGSGHPDYARRWKTPGDEKITDVPAFLYPNNALRDQFYTNSEIHVLKGDNIKLQYIAFSYKAGMPNSKVSLLKDFQLYLNLSNLGILWRQNKEGLDPDYPYSLPPSKSISFGIRGNF